MQIKSFFIPEDQDAANVFLKEQGHLINPQNILTFADKVVIHYDNTPPGSKSDVLSCIDNVVLGLVAQRAKAELNKRYWMGQEILKSGGTGKQDGATAQRMQAEEEIKDVDAQLRYLRQMREEVAKDKLVL
jgi:hypothetical protein